MSIPFRSTFFLALTAGLVAQSPAELLKLIPRSAASIELTWRPAEAEARYFKAMGTLDKEGSMIGLSSKVHLEAGKLAPGPVAVVSFEAPAKVAPAKPKAEVTTEPAWTVTYVPVKDPLALTRTLNAKPQGALQRYQWKKGDGTETRFLAFKGGYALIAERKALLEQTLKATEGIEGELADLLPWLQGHDTVVVATEATIQQAIHGFVQGVEAGAQGKGPAGVNAQSQAFLVGKLKGWAEKLRFSLRGAAVALDCKEGEGLLMTGRAFLKGGSPLAREIADSHAPAGPLLGALPDGPFALGMGGQWPGFTDLFYELALQDPSISSPQREGLLAALRKQSEQVESIALSLEAPAKGKPFLSGFVMTTCVKDSAAWWAGVESQQALMKGRLGEAYSIEKGVLDGRPWSQVSLDPNALLQGKLPPAQVTMFTSLIFGGSQVTFSQMAVDEHTILMVLGGHELLNKVAVKVTAGRNLASQPGIRQVNAALPEGGRFAIYVDAAGFQELLGNIMASMGQPGPVAKLDRKGLLPLGGVITLDDKGIQFTGLARQETLKAFAEVGKAFPGKGGDQASAGTK